VQHCILICTRKSEFATCALYFFIYNSTDIRCCGTNMYAHYDCMTGYLKLLKLGPSLLKYVPGTKVADLRTWLQIYSYWNQGGLENVVSMFLFLGDKYMLDKGIAPAVSVLKETPSQVLETVTAICNTVC
jgi:cobalamin biosynthesis Mg chelatase CobN